jgi:ferrous iron transport protein B
MGKAIQPIFAPAGFDWKITVGVLASFPAREVIVSTLGIIYSLGGDVDEESGDLKEALHNETWDDGPRAGQPIFNLPVVFSIMVFFALCSQCGSTLAVTAKESSWKWAAFTFFYMTALAWLGAVAVYQIGIRLM